MAKVKGVVILNGRDYALANGGEEAWARVLERLGPEDRQSLAAVIPVGWYDIGLYDLKTIHRLFLRLATPAYVIERSAGFWGRFQDSGTWTVTREPPNRVRARLVDWGAQDELTCIRLAAYMFRLFQLVGARNGKLERVACRTRGDPACVFEGKWD